MNKRCIFICLVLVFSGCVRTVQKYDPYEPETRSIASGSLGILPSKSREKKAFESNREEVASALIKCGIQAPGSGRFEKLVNDLRGPRCVESYSKITNDPVYLEKFLELLRKNVAVKAPHLSDTVDVHGDVPKDWLDACSKFNKSVLPPPLLRFAHLSDVQLRDEEVKLVSRSVSSFLDSFVDSVERNPSQEYFDLEYYLELVLGINNFASELKPDFMIHTGDATDVRTSQELYPFVYINNLLNVPWFNVVGNHDAATLGNFNNKKCFFRNVGYSFLSPGNLFNFMLTHGPAYAHDDSPLTPTNVHEDITWKTGSYFHGFDLCKGTSTLLDKSWMEEAFARVCTSPGYYSLPFNPGIRLIVLNTAVPLVDEKLDKVLCEKSSKKDIGADEEYITLVTHSTTPRYCYKGKVDKRQYDWLIGELRRAREDHQIVFVFGHHPLDEENFANDSYESLIKNFCRSRNVVAYFCGHTHEQEVKFIKDPDNPQRGFWQVNSGSILDYPQEGNLITLYNLSNNYLRIDVQSFGVFREEDFQDLKSRNRIPSNPLECMAFHAHAGAEKDLSKDYWKKEHSYGNFKGGNTYLPERHDGSVSPARNNYALYFPVPDGTNLPQASAQGSPSASESEIIARSEDVEREKRVEDLVRCIIHPPNPPKVTVEKATGEKDVLWRFHVEEVNEGNENVFDENPFLYRTLAYLVEKAGEKEGEVWQLVRGWRK